VENPIVILGIAGSLRRDSYNRAALRAAQALSPHMARIDIFDLDGIPPYNQDLESNRPAKVVELKSRTREADAILFATPEYCHSIPGVLKNAIDWAAVPHGDNAWGGKPVAIVGASIGPVGTARAQSQLRLLFPFLDMRPINQPEVMISFAKQRFDEEGHLTDENFRQQIQQLLANLVDWTLRLHRANSTDAELVHWR
jgi:chromate reductase, NAD(P)H dehydrogenase (quinone)